MAKFSDISLTSLNLQSDQKTEKTLASTVAQTHSLKTVEAACQSLDQGEVATQTKSRHDDVEFQENVDWQRFGEFLRRSEPLIMKTLQQNLKSRAFQRYEEALNDDVSVTKTHSLKHILLPNDIQALDLDWNCSGSTVGVVCGLSQHEDWCTHHGFMCTWNIERRQLNPSNADWSLELDSCGICIKFHPNQPGLVVVGCFTGEVTVFNLAYSEGNMQAAHSRQTEFGHKDPVTSVTWASYGRSYDQKLDQTVISSGFDGKILFWTIPARGQDLVLTRAFLITVGSLPRSLRTDASNTKREAGIYGIAFSKKEPDLFIAAGETGAILHCNQNVKDPTAGYESTTDVQVHNPVVLSLRPHKGPVYNIKESPFHRNVFLSCSADGNLRLYNILKIDPIWSAHLPHGYLHSACFSQLRPLVFAAGTHDGHAAIFDLIHSEQTPIVKIEVNLEKSPVYGVSFNPAKPDLLATADAQGVVQLWKLGERFSAQDRHEEEILNHMAVGGGNE